MKNTAVGYMPAEVLRITPLDEDGTPRHAWAQTYAADPEDPPALSYLAHRPEDGFHTGPLRYTAPTCWAALTARTGYSDPRLIESLRSALWQRRHHGAAVEAWARHPDPGRGWWYTLMPAWHYAEPARFPEPDPDEHREGTTYLTPGHHLYAAARLQGNAAYSHDSPPPWPGAPSTLDPGTRVLLACGDTPPPAAGLRGATTPPYLLAGGRT